MQQDDSHIDLAHHDQADWVDLRQWIWSSNLEFLLLELASAMGYGYTLQDKVAIEWGIEDSDSEQNHYFEYSFIADQQIDIAIAQDIGTEVLMIRIRCQSQLADRLKYLLDLAAIYDIRFCSQAADRPHHG